jgi:hypothetical protein
VIIKNIVMDVKNINIYMNLQKINVLMMGGRIIVGSVNVKYLLYIARTIRMSEKTIGLIIEIGFS